MLSYLSHSPLTLQAILDASRFPSRKGATVAPVAQVIMVKDSCAFLTSPFVGTWLLSRFDKVRPNAATQFIVTHTLIENIFCLDRGWFHMFSLENVPAMMHLCMFLLYVCKDLHVWFGLIGHGLTISLSVFIYIHRLLYMAPFHSYMW